MAEKVRVLIVDDDEKMGELLRKVLLRQGYYLSLASSGGEALRRFAEDSFNLMLTDIRMPEMDGLALLRRVREISPETTVIMMTAFGTVDSAVEAMKQGAYDYISKPFKMDEVLIVVARAVEEKRLRRELLAMRGSLAARYAFGNIIGKSKPMQEVFDLIRRVAPSSATVLIRGRSGTGKELVLPGKSSLQVSAPAKYPRFPLGTTCQLFPPGSTSSAGHPLPQPQEGPVVRAGKLQRHS